MEEQEGTVVIKSYFLLADRALRNNGPLFDPPWHFKSQSYIWQRRQQLIENIEIL